jgi:hypothetical protein
MMMCYDGFQQPMVNVPKAIYTQLQHQQHHSLPPLAPGASPHRQTPFSKKFRKVKLYPLFLKLLLGALFVWSLPLLKRAGRFTTYIDKHCTSCGAIENDAHLFFLCDLPQQV